VFSIAYSRSYTYNLRPRTLDLPSTDCIWFRTPHHFEYDTSDTILQVRYTKTVFTRTTTTSRPQEIIAMVKGKRKAKAEEGEEDKQNIKKARTVADFFHDKPE
jgi:hypothetical protein